jgi:outer membrane immunogenic protein
MRGQKQDANAMNRFLVGILVGAGFVGCASAADLPLVQAPPPIYPTTAVTWSGFYFGGHAGYGWSNFDFRDPTVTITTPGLSASLGIPLERKFKASNGIVGPQAGINAQFGPIVVGAEGDFSWTSMRGIYRSTSGPTAIGPFSLSTFEGAAAKVDWLSTLRSRVGYAFDRFLVYGTGGVAFGQVQGAGDVTGILPPFGSLTLAANDRKTHVGWTAGAGIEGMLLPNLSLKVEYLYADLGREHHSAPALVTGTPVILALIPPGTSVRAAGDFKVITQTIRVGLNYHFNWFAPGPVVARY